MPDEKERVELLKKIIPVLDHIKKLPMKNRVFSQEELVSLRQVKFLDFPGEIIDRIQAEAGFSENHFRLLFEACGLASTRAIHGLDPKTGKPNYNRIPSLEEIVINTCLGVLVSTSVFYLKEVFNNRNRKNFKHIFITNISWRSIAVNVLATVVAGVFFRVLKLLLHIK